MRVCTVCECLSVIPCTYVGHFEKGRHLGFECKSYIVLVIMMVSRFSVMLNL